LDHLLSDAVIRIAYHVNFGKVDPKSLDSHWNLEKRVDADRADPAQQIQHLIDAPDLQEALQVAIRDAVQGVPEDRSADLKTCAWM
jgi:hypothetical protein